MEKKNAKSILLILWILFFAIANSVKAQNVSNSFYFDIDTANYFDLQKHYSEKRPVEFTENFESEQSTKWLNFWKRHTNNYGKLNVEEVRNVSHPPLRINSSRSICNANLTAQWKQVAWDSAIYFPNNSLKYISEGIGRIDCIEFDPIDSNIIWIGSPTGGLWKTSDGGNTWKCMNDTLKNIGVSSIVINPKNPQKIIISTGDRDAGHLPSNGIYASTNSGLSWTKATFNTTNIPGRFYDMICLPSNPDIMFAATFWGVFKSINGGLHWTLLPGPNGIRDLEFKPNSNTLYVLSIYNDNATIYKSSNLGLSFASLPLGLSSSGDCANGRIATTSLDSNYLYVLLAKNFNLKGVYLSSDGGQSFNLKSNSPNIIGYLNQFCIADSTTLAQGNYCLDLAISPLNKNHICVGGISLWNSIDGGLTWSTNCNGDSLLLNDKFHFDIHKIKFDLHNPNKLWVGTDGGLFSTTNKGQTSTFRSHSVYNTQIVDFELSHYNKNEFYYGTQDNGAHKLKSNIWNGILEGDVYSVFKHKFRDDKIFLGSAWNGVWSHNNNSNTLIYHSISQPKKGYYISDEKNSNKIFTLGLDTIFYSTDYALSLNMESYVPFSSLGIMYDELIKDSYEDSIFYIYSRWGREKLLICNTITNSVSYFNNIDSVRYVVIGKNSNELLVNAKDISGNLHLYKSNNRGLSWSNYDGSLQFPKTQSIVFDKGTNGYYALLSNSRIYYRDSTLQDWIEWDNGLPNVVINNISISPADRKIYCSTYGRGMWQSRLYEYTPVAKYYIDTITTPLCQGANITFFDSSTHFPFKLSWTFQGGNPSSSNLLSPTVVFPNPGNYTVTLQVENIAGCDSITKNIMVYSIPNAPNIDTIGNLPACIGDTVILFCIDSNVDYFWYGGNTTQSNLLVSNYVGGLTISDSKKCKSTTAPLQVTFHALPDTTFSDYSDTICYGESIFIYASGNDTYLWSNGSTQDYIEINDTNNYSVLVTSIDGCQWTSDNFKVNIKQFVKSNILLSSDTLFCTNLGQNYKWYFNNQLLSTTNTNYIITSSPGFYQVLAIDSNECHIMSDSTFVTYNSIHEGENANIKLIPNPLTYMSTLTNAIIDKDTDVKVFSSYGLQVNKYELVNNQVLFRKLDYPSGIYWIVISNGKKQHVIKLVSL